MSTHSVEMRWTPRLAKQFCPVSSYFLANYARLKPHPNARGLTSSEAMFIIQLMDFKWDERMPYPTMNTLAERLGVGRRSARKTASNLVEQGYLNRVEMPYGPNRYDLEPLFKALESLMDEDIKKHDEED